MAFFTRRLYSGGAAATTTTNSLSASDTSVTLTSTTGWPSSAGVTFMVVIERAVSGAEEKCLATISGSTLTLTRGQDGTSGVTHASGVSISHCFSALDADQANFVASLMTTKGDILVGVAADVARLAVGTNELPLIALSTATPGVAYQALKAAGIGTAAITPAKLHADVAFEDQIILSSRIFS